MRVTVTHTLRDFEADQKDVYKRADRDMRECVSDGIKAGNELAKDFARRKNPPGSHSKRYPGTFRPKMHNNFHGFGSSVYSGEYGPLAVDQGILAPILENGDRAANTAQLNLAKSADIIGPSFAQEVRALVPRWFW